MASRSTFLFTTLLLCAYDLSVVWCQCQNTTALSMQVDALFAEYDREVLPSNNGSVFVEVSLEVKHAAINQIDSTMRLLADLKMKWQDKRISWNKTEWECDHAVTTAERLWLPDIVLLNAAATGVSTSPIDVGMRALINYDGSVSWAMRLDLTAPISLQLYNWPKDKQSCTFKFGSRYYSLNQIQLSVVRIGAAMFENGEWDMEDVEGSNEIWDREGDQLSVALWTVMLSRQAQAHAIAGTTVVIAAALMLTAAIALQPDQRHALAACASFTTALWLITCLVRLPGAHTCPRVVSIMCALCVCGALCAAFAGIVRRIALITATPPQILRSALHALSVMCSLTSSPDSCTASESGTWTAAAVLADRVLCAVLLLIVIVLTVVQLI